MLRSLANRWGVSLKVRGYWVKWGLKVSCCTYAKQKDPLKHDAVQTKPPSWVWRNFPCLECLRNSMFPCARYTVWDTHLVHWIPVLYYPCWMVPCVLVFLDHARALGKDYFRLMTITIIIINCKQFVTPSLHLYFAKRFPILLCFFVYKCTYAAISNMAFWRHVWNMSERDHIVALMQAGLRNKDVAKSWTCIPKLNITTKRYKMKSTTDSKHVPRWERPIRTERLEHPDGVIVWAAVGSDTVSKSPFIFIEEGVKVNSVVYMKILEDKVLPWLNESFWEWYIFTQDGALAHT